MTANIAQFGKYLSSAFRNTPGLSGTTNGVNLADTANAVADLLDNLDIGGVAAAPLLLSSQPTTNDTVTIGADIYQFKTALGAVTNDAYIGVAIGASAAATAVNLIAAINGTQTASGITMINAVTPAAQIGTESVYALNILSPQTVVVCSADGVGGDIIGADPSIVLAEAITAAADVWLCGNVSMATLAGRTSNSVPFAIASLTITTAMLTLVQRLAFPFAVGAFTYQVRSATGALKTPVNDLLVADGQTVKVSLVGGAGGDMANTDVLTVLVSRA